MNTLAALALAFAAMFGTVPNAATPAPQCATMGNIFQCDEDKAMSHPSVEVWEENFNLSYVTTRTDGAQPVVPDNMLTLQDLEFPNVWHVYTLRYSPMSHA